ncbi:hypothetical protein C8J57DRAFT_1523488 [Mycena rebaudengoi]|nr:hypothetical protein C8J57DRAFT_1523488 [Mycena rebaudengoi]
MEFPLIRVAREDEDDALYNNEESFSWLLSDEEDLFDDESCKSPRKCAVAFSATKNLIREGRCPEIIVLDSWNEAWGKNLCISCADDAKDTFSVERIAAWKKLPAIFGLPKWQDLIASDFE